MPPRQEHLGERMSSLEASVAAFEKYEHDRWHQLNNDLTALMGLPTQFAREMARLEGGFQGKIAEAVRQAIAPLMADMGDLKERVSAIETRQNAWGGARSLAVWIVQTMIAAAAVIFAVKTGAVK
jgi:hypothetical protein